MLSPAQNFKRVWMSSAGSWSDANGTPTQGLEISGKVLGCLHPITATLWIHVLGVATKLRGGASPMVMSLAYFFSFLASSLYLRRAFLCM